MTEINPLDVLIPGIHYKAYLVASLAMGSSPLAAIQHCGLSEDQAQWAMTFHPDNGSAIYKAIYEARQLGEEPGALSAEETLARLRENAEPTKGDIMDNIREDIQQAEAGEGRPTGEMMGEIEAKDILLLDA